MEEFGGWVKPTGHWLETGWSLTWNRMVTDLNQTGLLHLDDSCGNNRLVHIFFWINWWEISFTVRTSLSPLPLRSQGDSWCLFWGLGLLRRHKPRLDEVVEAESCLHLPGVDSERLAMSEVVDEMFVRSEEMVGRTVFLFFHLFICSSLCLYVLVLFNLTLGSWLILSFHLFVFLSFHLFVFFFLDPFWIDLSLGGLCPTKILPLRDTAL